MLQLAGATYLEVHAAGGGIHFTVDHVRKATEEQLLEDLRFEFQSCVLRTYTNLKVLQFVCE